jgi:transcriptional regulator with XRE-family HTH domain
MSNYDMSEAPVRVRLAREHHGLSIAEAADRTGVSGSTIRRLERRPRWGKGPKSTTLERLSRGYEVSSDWLMGAGPRDPMLRIVPGYEPRSGLDAVQRVARVLNEEAARLPAGSQVGELFAEMAELLLGLGREKAEAS